MTREEAIDELQDLRNEVYNEDSDGYIYAKAIDMAIEALQDDWIPVSERLPEEDKDVLVTVHFMGLKQTHPTGWNDHIKPSTYVEMARHICGEWTSDSDEYKIARNRHKVIAWQPLPDAYDGGDDNEVHK